MEKAIELQDVSYQYPHAADQSLRQLNLAVEQGKLVVVMGPGGAGKTTLALCLNGLIPQLLGGTLTGQIAVAGRDLRQYRVQTLARHIGLVLQDPETQIFGTTVAEDTAFGLCNFLVPAAEIEQRTGEALQWVRMQGYQERSTLELSGGEKQRLAIAGVLAQQPEILVLDEPASELDPLGRTEIYQTIAALRNQSGLTIVLVEHSGEAVIEHADQVVVLNRGGIVWQGAPDRLFRNIPLMTQFGIKPLPVTQVGWAFCQKGWLPEAEIPLDVPAAATMVRNLLARHGSGRFADHPGQPETGAARHAAKTETGESVPVILEVSGLTYQYPGSAGNGLHNINLTVHQGEFIALIGPNGAGKTTLAKHFNGLLQPDGGTVTVAGMDTRQYDTPRLAREVGYVFQNPDHQIFETSVARELEYGLSNLCRDGDNPLPETEKTARIDQALQKVGLAAYRDTHPFALGKGQRQLVALAAILVLQPKILVIDEPTTGLDWAGTQNIMRLIQALHESGTTVIMITHDMDLVARYAERVILMKEGAVLKDGGPREVLADAASLAGTCIVPPQIVRLSERLRDVGLSGILLHPEELIQAILEATEGESCQ